MPKEHVTDEDERPLSELKAELQARRSRGRSRYVQRGVRKNEYKRHAGPLVEQVPNQWRTGEEKGRSYDAIYEDEEQELNCCDLEDEGSCPNSTRRLAKSRRFRRMFVVLALLAMAFWYGWKWYIQPRLDNEWSLKEGFLPSRVNGTYGIARGGHFEGTRVQELDPKLIPGGEADPEGKRRIIFIGDIHGCKKELKKLLHKVGFDAKTDHIIATGDVISKGPDNVGVLDELIRLNADSVRGNHEDRILEVAKTVRDTNLPIQDEGLTSKGYSKDHHLLKSLHHKHINYLRAMPLILHIPTLPLTSISWRVDPNRIQNDIYVVHAGLVPHVPLEKQDPYYVMNMRSIDRETHIPSALRESRRGYSRPWTQIWNWYNDHLARRHSIQGFHIYTSEDLDAERKDLGMGWVERLWRGVWSAELRGRGRKRPEVVVYGHDSKMGLQMHAWSKGLDSACAAGGELTGMVLDARGRTEVVQVGCGNYR